MLTAGLETRFPWVSSCLVARAPWRFSKSVMEREESEIKKERETKGRRPEPSSSRTSPFACAGFLKLQLSGLWC